LGGNDDFLQKTDTCIMMDDTDLNLTFHYNLIL